MVTRVRPDGSWVEIADRKKRINGELRARAYFYEQKGFIVSSVSGISETGEPSILAAEIPDADLGRCFCDHLLEFNPRDATDSYRGAKLTDWKAFQVSGAKSVKAFEAKSWMLRADTVNTVLVITAGPRLSLHSEILAQGVANLSHAEIGAVIRRALKAAMVLRENGII